VAIREIEVYNFSALLHRWETRASARLSVAAARLSRGVTFDPEFGKWAESIQAGISGIVKALETHRKKEYSEYMKAEAERKQKEVEVTHQKELEQNKADAHQRLCQQQTEIAAKMAADAKAREEQTAATFSLEVRRLQEQMEAAARMAEQQYQANWTAIFQAITDDQKAANEAREQARVQEQKAQETSLKKMQGRVDDLEKRRHCNVY
jgi:hypothetical protein